MKLKFSKKLLLLAATSTLTLTGCGLDSELDDIKSVEFEDISETPEINYSSDSMVSYFEVLHKQLPEQELAIRCTEELENYPNKK